MITDEEWSVARRMWPDDEDADFTLAFAAGNDGTPWMRLSCSVHGPVVSAVTWEMGSLNLAVGRHYVLRHLRPRTGRNGDD